MPGRGNPSKVGSIPLRASQMGIQVGQYSRDILIQLGDAVQRFKIRILLWPEYDLFIAPQIIDCLSPGRG
jgi:hypothetical protein